MKTPFWIELKKSKQSWSIYVFKGGLVSERAYDRKQHFVKLQGDRPITVGAYKRESLWAAVYGSNEVIKVTLSVATFMKMRILNWWARIYSLLCYIWRANYLTICWFSKTFVALLEKTSIAWESHNAWRESRMRLEIETAFWSAVLLVILPSPGRSHETSVH